MGSSISRRKLLEGMSAAGVGGLVATGSAGAQGRAPLDRHIVGVEPGRADVATRAAEEVYRVLDFGSIGQAVSGWFSENALDGLRNNPNVRYIEDEGVMEALGHTTGEDSGDPTQEQVLPWGIDRVDADVAHHEGETGGGSSVAVIDTGIDPNHETLTVAGGEAFVSCDGGCAANWDDDNGHGTHCAGTADALDNGIGVVGASTEADLYAVKVLDSDGGGTYSDVAAGIRWTADQGIDVGSLSLGGSDSSTVADACNYAYNNGTLLVAAAGNDGPRPNSVSYPAAYSECIAVSATDQSDDIARFSSRGSEVELAAPGVDVLSTQPDDDYEQSSGTSMACPHVSGAGAQLMANGSTNTEARNRLNSTAEDIGLGSDEQGNGLLDVAAALGLDGDSGGDGNTAPTVDSLSASEVETGNSDAEFDVDWQVSDSDGNLDSVDLTLTDDTDGETEDTASVDVSADTASDTTRLVAADDDGSGNDYTVELVVTDSDGATDSDTTTVSETEDDGGDGSAPAIDTFELTDTSNPRWARVEVDWAVSDADGDLAEVTTDVTFANGGTDSETSSVGGGSASGTHELRERDGHGDADVTLTVTDGGNETTSATKTITLG